MSTLFAELRRRFAAGTLRGLREDEVVEVLKALPTETLRRLRSEALALAAEIVAAVDGAHRRFQEAERLYAQELQDGGQRPPADAVLVNKLMADANAKYAAMAEEFGLRAGPDKVITGGNVHQAANRRVALIGNELEERWRRDGEPEGMAEIRKALSLATGRAWAAQRAITEARKAYNGTHTTEAEAGAIAATAAHSAAVADVDELKRQAYAEYAVRIF